MHEYYKYVVVSAGSGGGAAVWRRVGGAVGVVVGREAGCFSDYLALGLFCEDSDPVHRSYR